MNTLTPTLSNSLVIFITCLFVLSFPAPTHADRNNSTVNDIIKNSTLIVEGTIEQLENKELEAGQEVAQGRLRVWETFLNTQEKPREVLVRWYPGQEDTQLINKLSARYILFLKPSLIQPGAYESALEGVSFWKVFFRSQTMKNQDFISLPECCHYISGFPTDIIEEAGVSDLIAGAMETGKRKVIYFDKLIPYLKKMIHEKSNER